MPEAAHNLNRRAWVVVAGVVLVLAAAGATVGAAHAGTAIGPGRDGASRWASAPDHPAVVTGAPRRVVPDAPLGAGTSLAVVATLVAGWALLSLAGPAGGPSAQLARWRARLVGAPPIFS
jgi:hypothetical protein